MDKSSKKGSSHHQEEEEGEEEESKRRVAASPENNQNHEQEARDKEALEEEIVKLKEYINHNYTVFVKRLEKRKEKIQILNEENASLKSQLGELDGYKRQMLEYRENYEQLEEFQNQELGKIKHMLLSTENSLQSEKKEKEALAKENAKLKELQTLESTSDAVLEELKEKNDRIAELENSLSKLEKDSTNNESLRGEKLELESLLNETRKNFEAYKEANSSQNENDMIKILESQLSMIENERDGYKNSLLELELDKHDSLEAEKKYIADRKLQEAKLNAERETLEVKLNHRESEIKKLKEESRTMKDGYDMKIKELEEASESKTYKILSLEDQIQELKSELNKAMNDLESKSTISLENANSFKRLESERDSLKDELSAKNSNLKEFKSNEASLKSELSEHRKKFAQLNKEFENCVSQIEELSSHREDLEMEVRKKSSALQENENEIVKLKRRLKDIDENLPGTIENSDLVKDLKSRIKGLEQDLEDKKSTLKLQDKRMADMKKTLQKELSRNGGASSSGSSGDHPTHLRRSSESTPSFLAVHDSHFLNGSARTRTDSSSSIVDVPINDVNVQYLKRAIFKFFTGRDDEAFQMIKVISTILKFSKEESKVLHEIWEWKHSWFASKPKLSHIRN